MKSFTQRRIGSDRIPVTKTEMRFLRGGRKKGEGDSKELLKRVEDGKRRKSIDLSPLRNVAFGAINHLYGLYTRLQVCC